MRKFLRGPITRVTIDLERPPEPTPEQRARLAKIALAPDSEIDYSDIPDVSGLKGWRRPGLGAIL